VTTDKIEAGYLPAYLGIRGRLGSAARVCELGVERGESLLLWRGLFPDGAITGVDHKRHEELNLHGCRFVEMDQADPALPGVLGGEFDLIVDDCSHRGDLTAASFAHLWPLLALGGYYVIEDWMIGLRGFCDHPMYDPGMVAVAAGMIERLTSPDAEVDEITYRYGLCVVHRKAGNGDFQAVP